MSRKAVAVVFALLALLGFSLTTSGAQAQATAPYASKALGITFPLELGGLRLMRITDFEQRQRGLGNGVYYNNQSPFVAVDVFIYDKNERIPSGHEPAAIRAEIDQSVADIHTVAASGLYADVRVLDGPKACRAGGVVFQCVSLQYLRTPQGQEAVQTRSLLLMRGAQGNYVKLRLSWPQAQHAEAEPVVDRWLAAFGRLLPSS